MHARGVHERVFGDHLANAAVDRLRAVRDLAHTLALAPFLGAVGVADGHAHD